MQNMNLYVI